MSDSSAKAKLAAAKKRFKELKELKENGNTIKKNEKKSDSKHFNNENICQEVSLPIRESDTNNLQCDPLEESHVTFTGNSYFSEAPVPNASVFFDSIPSQDNFSLQNDFNNVSATLHNTNPFNQQSDCQESDSVAIEYPEFKQNEIFEKVNLISNDDAKKLEEYLHQDAQEYEANKSEMIETDYESKMVELENYNLQLQKSLQPLQEQLEYHRKTFQILVDEKNELISQLNDAQGATKQKVSDNEDLQGRLRASRSRVADLEKEINCLKSLKNDFERSGVDKLKEYDNLVKEYKQLKESSEESQQISSELHAKLHVQVSSNQNLEKKLQDANLQLEKLQLRLQQLNMGNEVPPVENMREKHLEKQIQELQEALKKADTETELANKQYQQYVEQLNMQRQSLANRIETLTTENTEHKDREQNLIQHIGQLEKLIQEKPTSNNANSATENELTMKLNELQANLEVVTENKSKLEELCNENETERITLEHNLQEAQEKIVQLENTMLMQKAQQPNMIELLATMESDKVAAARAVTQNNELKKQLEELQEAFVRMSNDKLELTEKLEAEQHYNKEVHEKWKEKNSEVDNLRHELLQFKNNDVEMNKQILLQNQLTDRLRHYEAQGQMGDALQKQLQEYKLVVDTITTENQQLKQQLQSHNNVGEDGEALEEQLSLLKQTVAELKCEKDDLQNRFDALNSEHFIKNIPEELKPHMQTLRDLAESNKLNFEHLLQEYLTVQECKQKYEAIKTENEKLHAQLVAENKTEADDATAHDVANNGNAIATIDKEHAMEQRFTRMMSDVANLTEEKQRLEHIVLQLQGETETIGEYIALYQYQRAILKEKTSEKDEQLRRLSRDREEVKQKLEDLNALIRQLFTNGSKHQIPRDVLEKHVNSNQLVCSEHSHLQEQLNVPEGQPNAITSAGDNENNNEKSQTADKIMALLSEIKTSNLVQPNDSLENFNPCPWCSGQLITV